MVSKLTPIPSPSLPTLADVMAKIDAEETLTPTRRRDLKSSIRRLCRLLGRETSNLPADIVELRRGLSCIHPARAGISRKTLQNLKADVLAAIRLAVPGGVAPAPLGSAWRSLYDLLGTKRLNNGLSRFIRFCSARGVPPDAVDDEAVAAFMDHLRAETFLAKPNDRHRRTTRIWNEAVDTIDGWPQNRLSVPSFRRERRSTPIEKFLASFRQDIDAYTDWLSGIDLFAEYAPPKVCEPRTVSQRRTQIMLMASALLNQGWDIDQVEKLGDLVTPQAMKAILTDYLGRSNNEPSVFAHGLAKTLIHIARHWARVDGEHLEELKRLRTRLGAEPTGLTEKNKDTLRQFDDEGNVLRLLELPAEMIAEACRGKLPEPRAAVLVQVALAISILTHAPLRMHNLIGIQLDRHVLRPGGQKGVVHLVIPEDETKAGEVIDYPLPAETQAFLELYLARFRPALCDESCSWLFPGKRNGCKSQSTLSQQITDAIFKRTGLVMTPHQFRHLAAKLLLDHNPGNFEAARQLLAHKSAKSTTTFYAGMQTPAAARHYDRLLREKRRDASDQPGKGKKQ